MAKSGEGRSEAERELVVVVKNGEGKVGWGTDLWHGRFGSLLGSVMGGEEGFGKGMGRKGF